MARLKLQFAFLLSLACLGCHPENFRAETKLLPDGKIERTVYQPAQASSDEIKESPVWRNTHGIRDPIRARDDLKSPLSELLQRVQAGNVKPSGKQYWIASGTFADVANVPNHLVFKAPEGLPNGGLVRAVQKADWGLVSEWTWTETLTDCIALADHRVARTELAELGIAITLAACAETWGEQYDLKELEAWLRGDVTTCLNELCELCLLWGMDKSVGKLDSSNAVAFALVARKYGLDLLDANQQVVKDNAEIDRRVNSFLTKKLRQLVVDKQRQPLADKHVQDVLDTFHGDRQKDSRLAQALEKAANAKFGSAEKFEAAIERLGRRLFGLYLWPIIFRTAQNFDYQMEVPGFVVETNATLIGERKLRWKFDALEAFPLGHTMRAVFVVPNADVLARHFPELTFENREQVVEYLDAVREDIKLLNAIHKKITQGDVSDLNDWRDANPKPPGILKRLLKRRD